MRPDTEVVGDRASRLRMTWGPRQDLACLRRVMEDRSLIPRPVWVVFDAAAVPAGQFGVALPGQGLTGNAGVALVLHPSLAADPHGQVTAIAYLLTLAIWPEADAEAAEAFAAILTGCDREALYRELCTLADGCIGVDAGRGAPEPE